MRCAPHSDIENTRTTRRYRTSYREPHSRSSQRDGGPYGRAPIERSTGHPYGGPLLRCVRAVDHEVKFGAPARNLTDLAGLVRVHKPHRDGNLVDRAATGEDRVRRRWGTQCAALWRVDGPMERN